VATLMKNLPEFSENFTTILHDANILKINRDLIDSVDGNIVAENIATEEKNIVTDEKIIVTDETKDKDLVLGETGPIISEPSKIVQDIYKNELKNLIYDGKTSMRKFYTRLNILVVRATGLNEQRDKENIKKMVSGHFIEKLTLNLRKQLITKEELSGYDLADYSERIRWFQRVYLDQEKVEVNQMKISAKPDRKAQKETRSC
jgi:hypothetical protein